MYIMFCCVICFFWWGAHLSESTESKECPSTAVSRYREVGARCEVRTRVKIDYGARKVSDKVIGNTLYITFN